jgi:hypothetical protein
MINNCAQQQTTTTTTLPIDLANLSLPDQSVMEEYDVEALLRHELATGSKLDFDFAPNM